MFYLLLFQPLHALQSGSSGLSTLDERERACLAAFLTAGETWCSCVCSNFSLWEKSQSKKGLWYRAVPFWGRCVVGKVKLFLLPRQCIQTHGFVFFCKCYARTSLLEAWASINILLSVNNCLRQCSPRGSWLWLRGTGIVSWATAEFTAGTEVCVPVTQHIGEQGYSWIPTHMVLHPIAPTKVLLSVERC